MTDWASLHTNAFLLRIRPGMVEEYRRRHAELWPEMAEALRTTGVVHYDIYLHEPSRQVFGHMLLAQAPDPAKPDHPVILRWRAYMADVLEMDGDRPLRDPIQRVFHLTA